MKEITKNVSKKKILRLHAQYTRDLNQGVDNISYKMV